LISFRLDDFEESDLFFLIGQYMYIITNSSRNGHKYILSRLIEPYTVSSTVDPKCTLSHVVYA